MVGYQVALHSALIRSFVNDFLSTHWVPGTVLDFGDTVVKRPMWSLPSTEECAMAQKGFLHRRRSCHMVLPVPILWVGQLQWPSWSPPLWRRLAAFLIFLFWNSLKFNFETYLWHYSTEPSPGCDCRGQAPHLTAGCRTERIGGNGSTLPCRRLLWSSGEKESPDQ